MFAYGAYCSQPSLKAWDCTWCNQYGAGGFTPTAFFNGDSGSTFGFAGYHAPLDTIVVCFRGTQLEDLNNWITDLSSVQLVPYSPCSGCSVGAGFYSAYNGVAAQVRAAFAALHSAHPNANITFTGHSLGAALATLAAADIASLYPRLTMAMQTFGSPRVGNLAFAQHVQRQVPRADVMRMVWVDDIVPHLPPESLGFNHINTEVWMDASPTSSSGSFTVCNAPPFGEDAACADSVDPIDYSINDHLSYFGLQEECDT